MNYLEYVRAIQSELVIPTDNVDQNFQNILPRMIEYAELRIYRELDFLYTETSATALCTANSRNVTVPTNIFIVNSLNLITPSSTTDPELGTRVPLERVSLEFMNATWPTAATTGVPKQYALLDNTSARFAPTPASAYTAEFIGIYRPTPLSSTNTTTFISTNLPDLFLQASLIFGFQYQQYPEAMASAEQAYQTLRAGVSLETLRQKAQSSQWSPFSPSPIANAPRDRNAAAV